MRIINKKTNEVVGGVTEPIEVIDRLGFEKNLDKPDAKWFIIEQFPTK